MRLNTQKSINAATTVYNRFGSWEAVRGASELRSGVYVITRQPAKSNAPTSKPDTVKSGAKRQKAG
jgi:hypothetical protein